MKCLIFIIITLSFQLQHIYIIFMLTVKKIHLKKGKKKKKKKLYYFLYEVVKL